MVHPCHMQQNAFRFNFQQMGPYADCRGHLCAVVFEQKLEDLIEPARVTLEWYIYSESEERNTWRRYFHMYHRLASEIIKSGFDGDLFRFHSEGQLALVRRQYPGLEGRKGAEEDN